MPPEAYVRMRLRKKLVRILVYPALDMNGAATARTN